MAAKKDDSKVTSKEVTNNENVELESSEKTALEIEEATAQGKESTGKKFKLADSKKSYQEKDFTLSGDQEKELPEHPSDQLIARIRSGYIVEA